MRTARLLAALAIAAAALTAAACGGSSAPSGTSPAAPSVAQVAAQIGATGVSAFSPTLYASHEGSATWHGQRVDIATFATDELRDQWEAIAKQFGPVLEDGHDWAMTTGLPRLLLFRRDPVLFLDLVPGLPLGQLTGRDPLEHLPDRAVEDIPG